MSDVLISLPVDSLILAFYGLCLGSFSSVLIYRIPRDLPWFTLKEKGYSCWGSARSLAQGDVRGSGRIFSSLSRSFCPSCGRSLTFFDLIPLFSWMLSCGRCRHCGARIGLLYPMLELVCASMAVLLYLSWGWQWVLIPLVLMLPFLLAMIVIDWREMILPDELTLILSVLSLSFGLGVLWQSGSGDILGEDILLFLAPAVILPFLFMGVSWIVGVWRKRPALGWGDVKLMVPVGLCTGISGIPLFLIMAGGLGLLTAVFFRFQGRTGAFPFGPALCVALFLHLFLTGFEVE